MSRNFLTEAYQKLRRRLQQGTLYAGEDALNDAFCQLWGKGYDPASVTDGERLLYASAHRRQISLWRKEKIYPRTGLGDMQVTDAPPDTEKEELYCQVNEMIETLLTPLQKDILRRRDMEDESYRHIAQTLGMQEAAVRMQLSRARRIIRETYQKRQGK